MIPTTIEIKQAWAGLKNKKGYVGSVVITMAASLGALLCILSLAYSTLIKPLPYPNQDRLFQVDNIFRDAAQDIKARAHTYPGLIHLYKTNDIFSSNVLTAYAEEVIVSQQSHPTVLVTYASPEWFSVFKPELKYGRTFSSSESVDSFNPVTIISHALWKEEFKSDPNILEKKLTINGISFTIIGVTDSTFIEPEIYKTGIKTSVWLPWDYNPIPENMRYDWENEQSSIIYIGELAKKYNINQANHLLTNQANDKWKSEVSGADFFEGWTTSVEVVPLKDVIIGDTKKMLMLLLIGIVGLVVIATANISNLFMSRTAEVLRDLAIKAALGARKHHLYKYMLSESGILMAISAFFAVLVAQLGFIVLRNNLSDSIPRTDELAIGGFTLMMSIVLGVLFTLFFSYVSANVLNYRTLIQELRSSGKGGGLQVSRAIRNFLIGCQISIAALLIFINLALFKSAVDSIKLPLGFQTSNLVSIQLSLAIHPHPPQDQQKAIIKEIKSKLSSLPQVELISHSDSPLERPFLWALTEESSNQRYNPDLTRIDENYFNIINQPFREGADFTSEDVIGMDRKIIINDIFAKNLKPQGDSPLGLRLSSGFDDPYVVIGVVKSAQFPGKSELTNRVYLASSGASQKFLLKLRNGQTINRQQLTETLQSITDIYSVYSIETLEDRKSKMLFPQFSIAFMSLMLAILSIFLAALGLYGVINYNTLMRKTEIGTRMAIGARRKDIVFLIVKNNLKPIGAGVFMCTSAILILLILFSDGLNSYLSIELLVTYFESIMSIAVLSLLACYLPLRNIINKPPIHLLKPSE